MTGLVWDKVGDRVYENGIDRGVLYLPDGSGVPWNGLTSVIEKFDKESNPVYYDGMKISDEVVLGDFSATMTAVTYPDEFSEIEGLGVFRRGIFVGDQKPKLFGLCYRTQISNDLEGQTGHKIHVLYNVTALPSDKTYTTLTGDPTLSEFEWELTAVPEEVPGFAPTAHFVIKTDDLDPWLLEEIEGILYGGTIAAAALIPMSDLVSYINEWFRIKIIDNGDGTWDAVSKREGLINLLGDGLFEILQANAVYLNPTTFVIDDTLDVSEIPAIRIIENADGTWTATTEHDELFSVSVDGIFQILDANAVFISADLYQVSDTEE